MKLAHEEQVESDRKQGQKVSGDKIMQDHLSHNRTLDFIPCEIENN